MKINWLYLVIGFLVLAAVFGVWHLMSRKPKRVADATNLGEASTANKTRKPTAIDFNQIMDNRYDAGMPNATNFSGFDFSGEDFQSKR
jgi:uncharacterized membrane protein